VGGLLEQAGLNRVHVQRIEDELEEQFGPTAPSELPEELALAQQVLGSFWRPAPPLAEGHQRPHVFLGSPGSGKTTLLCKWLAQSVLLNPSVTEASLSVEFGYVTPSPPIFVFGS
jgi:hypothetical protein